MDDVVEFILLDKENRKGNLFEILKDMLEIAFKPSIHDNINPIVTPITTEFRKAKKSREPNKQDMFESLVYENNNEDGKQPVDLTKLIKNMEYMFRNKRN